MQELDFISAEGVIALVQEDLSSFDANNQLDPGRWYPWIRKVVSDLGIACLEYKHALLWVKNYKVEIPCDFYILDSAFLVNQSCCGPDKELFITKVERLFGMIQLHLALCLVKNVTILVNT